MAAGPGLPSCDTSALIDASVHGHNLASSGLILTVHRTGSTAFFAARWHRSSAPTEWFDLP